MNYRGLFWDVVSFAVFTYVVVAGLSGYETDVEWFIFGIFAMVMSNRATINKLGGK